MDRDIASTANPESWKGRAVLVTGCTGFIGSWLLDSLTGAGARVVGLARGVADAGSFTAVAGDINDRALVKKILGEHRVDTVFHLAGHAIVGDAGLDPVAAFEVNVAGSWSLLEGCRATPSVKRIVMASSEPVSSLDAAERRPGAFHPYLVSKRCAELVAASFHATFGTPVCVARISNLFGGGDPSSSRLVPGTIRSALDGEPPVIRGDGSTVRDYIHVEDVVRGLVVLARAMDDTTLHGKIFTLRSGVSLSVLEITRKILALMGCEDLEPRVLGEGPSEPSSREHDREPGLAVPGWSPAASLDRRLTETIGWYRHAASATS